MRDRAELENVERPERLWSTADVCEFLGLSARTVRRLITTQGLPCLKLGGTLRFDSASVASWARRQRKEV